MPHKIFSVTVDSIRGCELAQVVAGDKPVTVIGGNNAQGKSSFLDAIAMTLGGKKLFPKNPIYDERDEATATVRLDGESTMLPWPCTITRTLQRDDDGQITTRVRIEADDGSVAPSPQTILNDVLGAGLQFDPLAFVREKPAKQVDIVKDLVGLDFSELDAEHDKLYAERTHVNRVVKQIDGKIKQTEIHVDVPSEKVDVAKLVDKLKDADAHNNQIDQDAASLNACKQQLEQLDKTLATEQQAFDERLEAAEQRYKEDLAEAEARRNETIYGNKERFKTAEKNIEQTQVRLKAEIAALEEIDDEPIDTLPIQEQIANAGDINKKLDENAARLDLLAEKRQQNDQSKKITKRLKEIETEKAKLADAAEWPIQGMGFGADGLVLNGHPFQDLSSKEQLNCAVAIAFKLNPVFPFAMIRDGSLLDENALIELEAIAANHDGQVFLERVGEGQECHVVFEAGKIKK